jgi:hypothetical protein
MWQENDTIIILCHNNEGGEGKRSKEEYERGKEGKERRANRPKYTYRMPDQNKKKGGDKARPDQTGPGHNK